MIKRKRERGKAPAPAAAIRTTEESYTVIPTATKSSSPVPGVENELALLLIRAIKARRKLLSSLSKRHANISSSSSSNNNNYNNAGNNNIDDAENFSHDATTAFLNGLKVHAQTPHPSRCNTRGVITQNIDAPSKCVQFLLDITSEPTNSVHLRRSALYMTTQILVKSSNARQYFAKDQSSQLLNFIGVIERMGREIMTAANEADVGENQGGAEEEKDENNNIMETSRGVNQQYVSSSSSSPQAKLLQETVELIHSLANQFGTHYPQYIVASRLLGDISLHFAPSTNQNNNNRGNATIQMRRLRTNRDEALTLGPTTCCKFERMVDRADTYFRILIPRYGGFNSDAECVVSPKDDKECKLEKEEHDTTSVKEKKTGRSFPNQDEKDIDFEVGVAKEEDEDDDDDISIEWEEGDFESLSVVNDSSNQEKVIIDDSMVDHQAAVSHTLDVMTRSGALLDGQLTVPVGRGASCTITESNVNPASDHRVGLANARTEHATDMITVSRRRLHNLVRKIYSRHLPRLNQWIHALSHADAMKERAVFDPVTALMPEMGGDSGPVSLVLMSQEKRSMRGSILQRMMHVREDLIGILRSSESLGITAETKRTALNAALVGEGSNEIPHHDASRLVPMEHPMSSTPVGVSFSRKNVVSKSPRFRVMYRKR